MLEAMGRSTGAVIGTYGVERHVLRFVGQAAHSGSTPIAMRRDAFLAAAETALACREIARRHSTPGAGMVCTVGTVSVEPAIVTAVPGVCEIALDQRALEPDTLRQALADAHEAAARAAAANGVTVEWRHVWRIDPCRFDPRLVDLCADGGAGGDRARAATAVGTAARRRRDGPRHAGGDDVRQFGQRPVALQGRRHAGGRPRSDDRRVPATGRQDRGVGRGLVDGHRAPFVVRQSAGRSSQPSGRCGVVSLLFLLFAITYLDRVCVSVAGPRMQQDLA